MDKFKIQGGQTLSGEINISGSKNAALPLIAASIMFDERIVLDKIPHLRDVSTMIRLLAGMGVHPRAPSKGVQTLVQSQFIAPRVPALQVPGGRAFGYPKQ